MKILICGDSFAADWTVKYPGQGWPNLLAEDYAVTNLAQAGCSEYKIYQQLLSSNLNSFDCIIVSHTSPYRIYVSCHPVHKNDLLHKNSDLIYNDIKFHAQTNKDLDVIVKFYEQYFDLDYAKFVHDCIIEKIIIHLAQFTGKIIHITNLPDTQLPADTAHSKSINFNTIFQTHAGLLNHYNEIGNQTIYQAIKREL